MNTNICVCCPKQAGQTYWPACSLKCYRAFMFWRGAGAYALQKETPKQRPRSELESALLFPHRGRSL